MMLYAGYIEPKGKEMANAKLNSTLCTVHDYIMPMLHYAVPMQMPNDDFFIDVAAATRAGIGYQNAR
jgi:hypothetical protein